MIITNSINFYYYILSNIDLEKASLVRHNFMQICKMFICVRVCVRLCVSTTSSVCQYSLEPNLQGFQSR